MCNTQRRNHLLCRTTSIAVVTVHTPCEGNACLVASKTALYWFPSAWQRALAFDYICMSLLVYMNRVLCMLSSHQRSQEGAHLHGHGVHVGYVVHRQRIKQRIGVPLVLNTAVSFCGA